jgi:hypothetical protein
MDTPVEELPIAKFLRLKNGDDIICELVEVSDDEGLSYMIFNPMKIVYLSSEMSGYLQIAIAPWIFPRVCSTQEFEIDPADVLLMSEASEKMNNYYWKNLDQFEEPSDTVAKEAQEESKEEESMENIRDIINQIMGDKKRTFH